MWLRTGLACTAKHCKLRLWRGSLNYCTTCPPWLAKIIYSRMPGHRKKWKALLYCFSPYKAVHRSPFRFPLSRPQSRICVSYILSYTGTVLLSAMVFSSSLPLKRTKYLNHSRKPAVLGSCPIPYDSNHRHCLHLIEVASRESNRYP